MSEPESEELTPLERDIADTRTALNNARRMLREAIQNSNQMAIENMQFMINELEEILESQLEEQGQQGDGILLREAGKFPPADRKLIEEVGGEKVEKLTLFRYPIQLSKFAKFIGALKNTPYDDLIHIGVVINGKYLTEKDAVLNFERAGVPSQSTDTLDVQLGNKSITINDLLENTRKRMGDERFSTYKALSWNCQDYLQNMLEANGVSTAETTKFIKQDLEQVVKNLPSFANAISNFFTGAKAVVNRLTKGEGDGCQCGGVARVEVANQIPDNAFINPNEGMLQEPPQPEPPLPEPQQPLLETIPETTDTVREFRQEIRDLQNMIREVDEMLRERPEDIDSLMQTRRRFVRNIRARLNAIQDIQGNGKYQLYNYQLHRAKCKF